MLGAMRPWVAVLTLASIIVVAAACAGKQAPPVAPSTTATASAPAAASPPAAACPPAGPSGYDAALAQRLGADERGMHKYVIAFLKQGPNRPKTPEEGKQLMQAHLANIVRLADEGSLVIAGPFLDNGPLRGIYIFKVETVEEARALTTTDPAIQSGSLEMDLHPWYGSAALQEVNGLHKRVQKKSVIE